MNIFFSGIGGVGIGPLALVALDSGFGVIGSDISTSSMTDELSSRGVQIEIGQTDDFLRACHNQKPIDWFVHTSALSDSHPELTAARELGIKTAKRDELLARILQEKNLKLIACAGTHGKTTTTGMVVWALQQLGVPVSYSIGTSISFGPSGRYDPASEYFVYECDEFDNNFLTFHPYISIISSLGYDHPDTFPTEADYRKAFEQFASQSEMTISWQDQAGEMLAAHPNAKLLSTEPSNITLAGAHNRRNAALVLETIKQLAIGGDALTAINSFPGTSRRFEKLADNLYSDYGHHPTEIAATLQMARELSDDVVLVYQPHQNVRQHEIKNQYSSQFELAEKVYWLPTYLSREDSSLPILNPEELIQNITNKSSVQVADLDESLWKNIQIARQEGKLVIAMGAGSIDSWLRQQID